MSRLPTKGSIAWLVAVGVISVLAIQNGLMRRRLTLIDRSARPGIVRGEPFARGDSLLRLTLTADHKADVPIANAIETGFSVFYFYKPGCASCEASWQEWQAFVQLYGNSMLAFVRCDPEAPARTAPEIVSLGIETFSLPRQNPLRHKFPYVPQLVVVNRCGIVTDTPKSVSELARLFKERGGRPHVLERSGG